MGKKKKTEINVSVYYLTYQWEPGKERTQDGVQ